MSLFILLSFYDIASDIVSVGVIAAIVYWFVYRRKIVSDTEPTVVEIDSTKSRNGVVGVHPALAE